MSSSDRSCPCGKGTVTWDESDWKPDIPIRINCPDCRETHEITTTPGGIDPRKGHSYDSFTRIVKKGE